jgi:hypothetical protein
MQPFSYSFHRTGEFRTASHPFILDFDQQSADDGQRSHAEQRLTPQLSLQLEQVQNELARKLREAKRVGDCLVDLALRLRHEPWKWSLGWVEEGFPVPDSICPMENEIVASLDRNRLEWLLEDIRMLKRREAELKKLVPA